MRGLYIFELLRRESAGAQADIIVAVTISGMANAGILAIINAAAQTPATEPIHLRLLVLFLITILLYIVALRFTFARLGRIFERMVDQIRIRLSSKIASSELPALEHIGRSRIYARLTHDTTVLSESKVLLTAALQSSVMVLFTVIYVAILSPAAFLSTVVMVAGGIQIYFRKNRVLFSSLERTNEKENELFGLTTHLLEGFKELKMSRARGEDLLTDIRRTSGELRELKIQTNDIQNSKFIFSQSAFFVLMAVMVFVLPRLIESFGRQSTELVAAVLFLMGPLSTVVRGIPQVTKADLAASSIARLESELDAPSRAPAAPAAPAPPLPFERAIELHGAVYSYPAADNGNFTVGPLQLRFEKGRVTFITGGNGSGKSSLLKLLTRLYEPHSGGVTLDGTPISAENVQEYRELFSPIFSDFHLFRKLYGMQNVDPGRVEELLSEMHLSDKTGFSAGTFTHIDLSTGQRKRLAMIVAELENRPILVFDEWAADQDPEFREHFYTKLIPSFRDQGKTVIAVTHDDRYYAYADRRVKLDLGKIVMDTQETRRA